MAEPRVGDNNYYLVAGWMLNRLCLKGTALQVFSIIYGFSQDGEGNFSGSLQYLQEFTGASKNTVLKALKDLTELGYISKTESSINGVRFCTYKIAPLVQKLNRGGAETEPGWCKNCTGGGAETEPNNKYINNKEDNKEYIQEVIDLFHKICVSFPSVRAVTDKRKKAIQKMKHYSMDDFRAVFENAESSTFLKGKTGWRADFDWLVKEDNFLKVLEGNYADRGKKEPVPGWTTPSLGDAELEAIQRVLSEEVSA